MRKMTFSPVSGMPAKRLFRPRLQIEHALVQLVFSTVSSAMAPSRLCSALELSSNFRFSRVAVSLSASRAILRGVATQFGDRQISLPSLSSVMSRAVTLSSAAELRQDLGVRRFLFDLHLGHASDPGLGVAFVWSVRDLLGSVVEHAFCSLTRRCLAALPRPDFAPRSSSGPRSVNLLVRVLVLSD